MKEDKEIFLNYVRERIQKNPSLCKSVIDSATIGIKEFADKQSDIGLKTCSMLFCILDTIKPPKNGKFGSFTAQQVIDFIEPYFSGTPAIIKLKKKFLKRKGE